MDMKDFAKYLKNIAFQDALHKARRLNMERVSGNEEILKKTVSTEHTPTKKIA